MAVFFTADTHFFHHNVIDYCKRGFTSFSEMNEKMVEIWNGQVKKGDVVYHLGDVSFGGLAETFALLARLNGDICLLLGNHDDMFVEDPYLRQRFLWIAPYYELVLDKRRLVLSHYPMLRWREAERGAWHLHGHVHGQLKVRGAALDVGFDAHPEFRLWHYEEVCERLKDCPSLQYPKKKVFFERNWKHGV